jgi:bacterioferritin-associated ferredoxin
VYVCSCTAVTDRTVNAVIASGAGSIEEITERCRAGGRCGGCWPALKRMLDARLVPSDAAAGATRAA